MKTAELAIEGMTCRKCAKRIRETLEKETGVIDAQVSLTQHRAVVHFDPEQTTVDRILDSEAFTRAHRVRGSHGQAIIHRYKGRLEERA
jgi:copper chaperone CopZ